MYGLLEKQEVKSFLLAGRAVVTIESKKTGKRYTYKISKCKDKNLWFVSTLVGGGEYAYTATFANGQLYLTPKSKAKADSGNYVAIKWVLEHLDRLPETLNVYHEGKCGKCGRSLTDPESIKIGLGPICRAV